MKQSRSMLRIVDSEIDDAFESAKVSLTTPIPLLGLIQAEGTFPPPIADGSGAKVMPTVQIAKAVDTVIPILPATSGVPTEDTVPGKSLVGRVFAFTLVATTLAVLGWIGMQVYYVVTDGWVAPLHLSPDSDQVQALRMAHQRQLDELSRIDAEVSRLDGEIVAIETAITKLSGLRATRRR